MFYLKINSDGWDGFRDFINKGINVTTNISELLLNGRGSKDQNIHISPAYFRLWKYQIYVRKWKMLVTTFL